jgi:protein tyrosine/serine phosphatase
MPRSSATKPGRLTVIGLLTTLLLFSIVTGPRLAMGAGEEHWPTNFGMMEEWLYRGAAPDGNQLRSLAELGISTIIDLRSTAQRGYGAEVCQLGMTYVRLPLRPRSVPSEQTLQRFLSILDSEEGRPVYVHCRAGKHRAGLLLALYRVLEQGTDRKDALAEMRTYGFGRGHRRMTDFFLSRTGQSLPDSEVER